ncbi:hypothetical protein [uncultured Rikenella sp.]|uniref:hypothetical protein n=1 Tax=uncultured Rikenella sp. TaxID=368003 RepID=UPI0025FAEC51|nr:hypothetical protein [uncultured Rikenella sp.]
MSVGTFPSISFVKQVFFSFFSRCVAAPGFRCYPSGVQFSVGDEGTVWSASANGTNGVYLRFVKDAVQPSNPYDRAGGFQLRCLSEETVRVALTNGRVYPNR